MCSWIMKVLHTLTSSSTCCTSVVPHGAARLGAASGCAKCQRQRAASRADASGRAAPHLPREHHEQPCGRRRAPHDACPRTIRSDLPSAPHVSCLLRWDRHGAAGRAQNGAGERGTSAAARIQRRRIGHAGSGERGRRGAAAAARWPLKALRCCVHSIFLISADKESSRPRPRGSRPRHRPFRHLSRGSSSRVPAAARGLPDLAGPGGKSAHELQVLQGCGACAHSAATSRGVRKHKRRRSSYTLASTRSRPGRQVRLPQRHEHVCSAAGLT